MEISKENLYVDCEQSLNLHNFIFSLAARGSEERTRILNLHNFIFSLAARRSEEGSRTTALGLICM